PRVKAGVNLDGLMFGEAPAAGFGRPFLFISDGTPVPTAAEVEAAGGPSPRELTFLVENGKGIRRGLAEQGGCYVTLHGSSHMNFCDSPLYSPLRALTRAGTIPRERAMEIINAYLVSFFQTHLNRASGCGLAALSERYPEAELETPGGEKS